MLALPAFMRRRFGAEIAGAKHLATACLDDRRVERPLGGHPRRLTRDGPVRSAADDQQHGPCKSEVRLRSLHLFVSLVKSALAAHPGSAVDSTCSRVTAMPCTARASCCTFWSSS